MCADGRHEIQPAIDTMNAGFKHYDLRLAFDMSSGRYCRKGFETCRSGLSDKADIPLDFVRTPSIGVVSESRLS